MHCGRQLSAIAELKVSELGVRPERRLHFQRDKPEWRRKEVLREINELGARTGPGAEREARIAARTKGRGS